MTAPLTVEAAASLLDAVRADLGRVLIGQEAVVEGVLLGLLSAGHVLLEGTPGLGKTLAVKTLAQLTHLQCARVQFTPDLMPADITGGGVLVRDPSGGAQVQFRPGPVFTHILIADEINRGTPKTQSALLEAMAEGTVTIGGEGRALEAPFVVFATQNPIEMEGTYPLPEAQLDRFLLKLVVPFPDEEALLRIAMETSGPPRSPPSPRLDRAQVLALQALAAEIVVAPALARRAVQLTLATHPDHPRAPALVQRCVRHGASPRATQALLKAGRARALLRGRAHLSAEDLQAVALPVLRHRIFRALSAELDGISADALVAAALASVPA